MKNFQLILLLFCVLLVTSISLQAQIDLQPDSSTFLGKVTINNTLENNGMKFPSVDGNDGQVLTTDGMGNLSWRAPNNQLAVTDFVCDTPVEVNIDDASSSTEDCGILYDAGGPFGSYGSLDDDDFQIQKLPEDSLIRVILVSIDIGGSDEFFIEGQAFDNNSTVPDTLFFETDVDIELNAAFLTGGGEGFEIHWDRLKNFNIGFFQNEEKQSVGGGVEIEDAWSNIGAQSILFGYGGTASSLNSTSLGYDNDATGEKSTAVGYRNEATQARSTALGNLTNAKAFGTTAVGYVASALAENSSAFGFGTLSEIYQMTALGSYNVSPQGSTTSWVSTDPVFVVGNGQNSSSRSTAMTILKNGNVGIGLGNPKQKLDVSGDIAVTNGILRFYDGTDLKSFINFSLSTDEMNIGVPFGSSSGIAINNVLQTRNEKVLISLSSSFNLSSLLTIRKNSLNGDKLLTLDNPGANEWIIDVDGFGLLQLFSSAAGSTAVGSFNSTSGDYTSISDARLKTNVQQLEDGTLDELMNLRPSSYYFKHDKEQSKLSLGFIAQEVEKIFPEVVVKPKSEKEHYMLSYSELGVIAIKAIQELNQKVEEKESENTALQQQVNDQQQQIETLEQRLARLEQLLQNTTETDVFLQGNDQAYLKQNAPNPFNENTVIEYYLPKGTTDAYLRIVDQTGKVLQLIKLEHEGQGQVNLTEKELPSGTYSYSLILDGKILETKQMILTK